MESGETRKDRGAPDRRATCWFCFLLFTFCVVIQVCAFSACPLKLEGQNPQSIQTRVAVATRRRPGGPHSSIRCARREVVMRGLGSIGRSTMDCFFGVGVKPLPGVSGCASAQPASHSTPARMDWASARGPCAPPPRACNLVVRGFGPWSIDQFIDLDPYPEQKGHTDNHMRDLDCMHSKPEAPKSIYSLLIDILLPCPSNLQTHAQQVTPSKQPARSTSACPRFFYQPVRAST